MNLQRKCKPWLKKALLNSGAVKLMALFTVPGLAVLRYHSVQDKPEHYANSIGYIIHKASAFEEQMQLVAEKFDSITIDDIYYYLCGKKIMPRRSVAVTFDDGFNDNFEIAAPILERYGIRATFYVTVSSVNSTATPPWFIRIRHAFWTTKKEKWVSPTDGSIHKIKNKEERNAAFLFACEQCACTVGNAQENLVMTIEHELAVKPLDAKSGLMMSWDQIRALHQAGHIIGSHTLTHPNLAHVGDEELHLELTQSKRLLEKALGEPVFHFSYPSPILEPHWTKKTLVATEQAGYKTAVTCSSGPVRIGDNPLSLNRIWVPPNRDALLWNLECTLLGRCM